MRSDVGVGVGTAVEVGVGVGVGTAVEVGVGVRVGTAVEVGVGMRVGTAVEVGIGVGVGTTVGVCFGTGVGVAAVPQAKAAARSSATAIYRTMFVCSRWCISKPFFTPPKILQRF